MNKKTFLIASGLSLMVGCSQNERSVSNLDLANALEEITFEENYEDPNLLKIITANLGEKTIGGIYFYKNTRMDLEIITSRGTICAIDYDNDGIYDKITSRNIPTYLITNKNLIKARDEILRLNQK